MPHDFDDFCLSSTSDLPIDSLAKVEGESNQFPSPALVSQAVSPKFLSGEWRVWVYAVTYEASCGVGVHCQQERDEKMVCVPKRLIALLSDLGVRRCVHQQHAQEHDMSCYPSSFGIVDLHSRLRSDLVPLHVEEIDIMRARVDNRPEQKAIRYLPVKVLAFIQG